MSQLDLYKQQLKTMNLDIRQTHNSRVIDQKCTPDIMSVVAECIQEFEQPVFSIKDIWTSEFSKQALGNYFQKPKTDNDSAKNEYDKVFSQPINLLNSAGIIRKVATPKGKRGGYFEIADPKMLNFIAIRDRNAFEFLNVYLIEILQQSGVWYLFENFFNQQDKQSFELLKESYESFLKEYTPINGKDEPRRIFTKVINPLAVKFAKLGTKGGRLSKNKITYSELLYNRVNFRDENKPKEMTRVEFQLQYQPQKSDSYYIDKAKRQVKAYHQNISEIHPICTLSNTTHAHHIFLQSEFSVLADTFENLAVLTTLEHYTFAHPNGSTNKISYGYQLLCLLAKLDSIKNCLENRKDGFYELDSFLFVLDVGLNGNLKIKTANYEDIKTSIVGYYLNELGNNFYNLDTNQLIGIIDNFRYSPSIIVSDNYKALVNQAFSKELLLIENKNLTCEYALNSIVTTAINHKDII